MNRSVLVLTLASLVFMIGGYGSSTWVGRFLGPHDLGAYGIIVSLFTIINSVQITGIPQSVSKFIAENEEHKDAVLLTGIKLQLIVSALFTLAFMLLSTPIAHFLHDDRLRMLMFYGSLTLPVYGIYALYAGYFNGLHQFTRQALMTIMYSLAKLALVITLSLLYQLPGAVYGYLVSAVGGLLVGGMRWPHSVKIKFGYQKLIRLSLPLVSISFLSIIVMSVDLFMIKRLLKSDEAAGFYAASQNIARIPYFAFNGLLSVTFPVIARSIAQGQSLHAKLLIKKVLRPAFLLLLFAVVLIASTSSQLIVLVYSDAFLPAAASLSILVVGTGIFTFFTVLSSIISSSGYPYVSVGLMAAGLLTTSLFLQILIPMFGVEGAAAAFTIGSIIPLIGAVVFVRKKFSFQMPYATIIKGLGSAAAVGGLMVFMHADGYVLPVFYAFFTAFYYVLLNLLKENSLKKIKQLAYDR